MRYFYYTLILTAFLSIENIAQNVNVPDTAFKSTLLLNSSININNDSEIQLSEALSFTGQIAVNGKNIQSLAGIEYFTKASYLLCNNTSITSLDLTHNDGLGVIGCNSNKIITLQLPINSSVFLLNCGENQIVSLDLSKQLNLGELICSYNQINDLDLSANMKLSSLDCDHNKLKKLDLTGKNLVVLNCGDNEIEQLDASSCPVYLLYCYNNKLKVLNMKGEPDPETLHYFEAGGNSELECIMVNDPNKWQTLWQNKVPTNAIFTSECNYPLSIKERNVLKTPILYPSINSGRLFLDVSHLTDVSNIKVRDSSGQIILESVFDVFVTPTLEVILTDPKPGIYFLTIQSEIEVVTTKFVVR